MKNIFAKFQEYVKKPKRNVFDMTFRNNLTLKFGELTPVFCKEVIPGDSFKIETTFGLMLMPMKFPVQTPMKAYVHYFYVRNRNTWKDWMDFIGGTKENLVPPYVQPLDKKTFYRVGGLADYLGVPNTIYTDEDISQTIELPVDGATNNILVDGTEFNVNATLVCPYWVDYAFLHYLTKAQFNLFNFSSNPSNSANEWLANFVYNAKQYLVGTTAFSAFRQFNPNILPNPYGPIKTYNSDVTDIEDVVCLPWNYLGRFSAENGFVGGNVSFEFTSSEIKVSYEQTPIIQVYRDSDNKITNVLGSFYHPEVEELGDSLRKFKFVVPTFVNNDSVELYFIPPYSMLVSNSDKTLTIYGNKSYQSGTNVVVSFDRERKNYFEIIGDGSLSVTPYDNDIHLSALPFRAYESIYNAYYRNPQNNPFVLDGTPEYNKYISTNEGGADYTQYDLYFRNWEYDFLTSAVQSPQQGIAPLVGMSMTGEATFADEEGNTFYAQAILNDDGEITGWQSHSSNMPVGSLRLLMDMANTGISINDLRNVNAFQRFLENNIRHGLKYRDQLMSHFGVKARYDELDMPEFIGGVSGSLEVFKVSQTSNDGDTPLGSFVGQAQIKVESNHSVTHYCDEHGFIIGIMSVVPVPVYSQLLPKYFIKSSQLDYFFPEFGHIGYQPILQKEVSPLQTFYSDHDLNKVFGYNRAWYDYLASTDEVHGQFRTTMRDFIMNRTFKTEPELGEDFLLVDPNQLNDVFLAGTDDDLYAPEADKIIGSLFYNVSAKRPIPLFGIPKLEA